MNGQLWYNFMNVNNGRGSPNLLFAVKSEVLPAMSSFWNVTPNLTLNCCITVICTEDCVSDLINKHGKKVNSS